MTEDPNESKTTTPLSSNSASEWRQALWAMAAVLELTASILASAWVGLWLDRFFQSGPFGLLGCVALGGGTGFWLLWRFSRPADRDPRP
ncbi:AtpZ/AtpI family protein [Myxococcota bacterium]|nr:AtpZ/AtpI family protein [Myxococcota bacterium]